MCWLLSGYFVNSTLVRFWLSMYFIVMNKVLFLVCLKLMIEIALG